MHTQVLPGTSVSPLFIFCCRGFGRKVSSYDPRSTDTKTGFGVSLGPSKFTFLTFVGPSDSIVMCVCYPLSPLAKYISMLNRVGLEIVSGHPSDLPLPVTLSKAMSKANQVKTIETTIETSYYASVPFITGSS